MIAAPVAHIFNDPQSGKLNVQLLQKACDPGDLNCYKSYKFQVFPTLLNHSKMFESLINDW